MQALIDPATSPRLGIPTMDSALAAHLRSLRINPAESAVLK